MSFDFWLPQPVAAWLGQHAGFLLLVLVFSLALLAAARPFIVWLTGAQLGRREALENKQILLDIHAELKALNQLLRTPLKKAEKPAAPSPAVDLTEKAKMDFLSELEKIRGKKE